MRFAAFCALWLAAAFSNASGQTMQPLSFSEFQAKMRGFQESRILLTAVELDLFTAVGDGATAQEAARRASTHPRATEIILNALVAIGALSKKDGRFFNTPATQQFLVAGSPDFARPALMHTVRLFDSWATLTECVRRGTAVREPGVEAQDPQWTESFIEAMHWRAQNDAAELARIARAQDVKTMLDIGGGSGVYSVAFAKANPQLRAEILDLEPVTRIAQRHIRAERLEDRVVTRVGDLKKEEFGSGYDLILLSAICHMLDERENLDLLRRCFRALAPGGRVLIRDFILEPDKTSPPHAAIFSVNMLVNTKGGANYTEEEYASWLREAGFSEIRRESADLITGRKAAQ
jgi:predicted O-methyltransferase YrrM